MYITLSQLAVLPGATELAQVASTEHEELVPPDLMELMLRDGDLSDYDADSIARAQTAVDRITEVVNEADTLIDGYLARRVTVPTPVPSVLVTIARAIVRYELHKHRISDASTDPVARDYALKLKLLEAIRDGDVTLGATDPVAADNTGTGEVRIESDKRVFSRCETRGFR